MLIRVRGKPGPRPGDVEYPPDAAKPRVRGDCARGERPCLFCSCRHHLFLEVQDNGNIKTRADEVDDMPETCALDFADRGPATLEEVGETLGVTREMIRQIEAKALSRLRRYGNKPLAPWADEYSGRMLGPEGRVRKIGEKKNKPGTRIRSAQALIPTLAVARVARTFI